MSDQEKLCKNNNCIYKYTIESLVRIVLFIDYVTWPSQFIPQQINWENHLFPG